MQHACSDERVGGTCLKDEAADGEEEREGGN